VALSLWRFNQTLIELNAKGRFSMTSFCVVKQVPVGLKNGVVLKMVPQQVSLELDAK